MSGAIAPMLRHAGTGVALPFFDTRVVPRQTLMEYLGCDRSRFDALFAQGLLTPAGGHVETGDIRPQVSYIPAVIWAVNRWTPPEDVLRVLACSAPELATHLAATRSCLERLAHLLPRSAA